MHSPIYLDNNATTPILPEVAEAVRDASLQHGANPDSQHEAGRLARRALEDARERIGELLGAQVGGMQADQIVITSGGTEAANLALHGLAAILAQPAHLLTSAIEHPCIGEACDRLAAAGWKVDRAQPNKTGVVAPDAFEQLLRPETRLVSLMLANNETGVVQPVAEVTQLCAHQDVLVHTDAAQAVGKIPVNFAELGVHALSCTAHKFRGPLGVGVLVIKHGLQLKPLLVGGHQQAGLRPGTQTVALAVGMRVALETWQQQAETEAQSLAAIRDEFEQRITTAIPAARVIGTAAQRLPNTSNIAFVGLNRQAVAMALDLAGVACSSGSACASGSSEPSPILMAMGLEKPLIDGSLRFSFGTQTSAAEVHEATGRIINVCKQLGLSGNP